MVKKDSITVARSKCCKLDSCVNIKGQYQLTGTTKYIDIYLYMFTGICYERGEGTNLVRMTPSKSNVTLDTSAVVINKPAGLLHIVSSSNPGDYYDII